MILFTLLLWGILGISVVNFVIALFTHIIARPFAASAVRAPVAILKREPSSDDPFVSVHLAIHDEPPQVVNATLDALAKLQYANFEVIILDNNTPDSAVWQPVKIYAAELGPQFRFYHFAGVEGAKAGALNIALELSDLRTRFVAVVDADYQVATDFLSHALNACDDSVKFAQFPQSYRCAKPAKAVVSELADYFETFPRAANQAQASLLTGTLSLISVDALRRVGGWPIHSITEDAELGVTLWTAGERGIFVDRDGGNGLLPMSLQGLRAQRRRWVTGNVQTLLKNMTRIKRTGRGAVAVFAQLTAWLGLLALPLTVLILVATINALPQLQQTGHAPLMMLLEVTAAGTFIIVLGGHVLRAVIRRRISSLAVTWAMLWTSSFSWFAAFGLTTPQFIRTPKTQTHRREPMSIDTIGSIVALAAGVAFFLQGSLVTAVVLGISAMGLVTAPFVDRSLRRAAA